MSEEDSNSQKIIFECPECGTEFEGDLSKCPSCRVIFEDEDTEDSLDDAASLESLEKEIELILEGTEKEGGKQKESDEDLDEEQIKFELDKELQDIEESLEMESEEKEKRVISKKGFTNGKKNLKDKDRKNGSLNGMTNGKTNGMTNGKTNGMTNGKTNGMTNGLTNGMTNGKTNGMTNGLTNGIRRKQKYIREKIKTKKLVGSALVVLIVFGILIAGFYMYSTHTPSEDIYIDGDFEDWDSIEKYSMEFDDVSEGVRIEEFAIHPSRERLNFYIKTEGIALQGGEDKEMDHMYVFLNSPYNYNGRYQTPTIEASHMIRINGWDDILTADLYTYTNSTDARNWYSWQRTASVPIERSMNEIEFSMLQRYLGEREVETYLVSKDHQGNIYCNDYVVMPGKPSLRVQQSSLDMDTISDSDTLLELNLRAYNDDVEIVGIEFNEEQEFTDIQFVGGDPFPINLDKDETLELSVIGSPTVEIGDSISLSVSDILTEAAPTIVGKGGVYYYEEVPESPVIDGAFGDWLNNFDESTSSDTSKIGIESYNAVITEDESLFYLRTQGNILEGTPVPEGIQIYEERLKDSDGDGIPDIHDPYPNDFTNDGTPDSEMVTEDGLPDVDGDGVADWPYGPDMWLNTTIPEDPEIPEKYWGREVSRYIGPRPTPEISGEDTLEVYLDSDEGRGYSIHGMRADHKIVIKGQYGEVTSSQVFGWDGGWELLDIELEHGIGLNELEFKTQLGLTDGEYEVLFRIEDWQQNVDQVGLEAEIRTEQIDNELNHYSNQLNSNTLSSTSESLENLVSGDGTSDEGFGWNVSQIGDFNGNGFDDLIVGAPYNSVGGENAGAAYIFFGYSTINTADIHASNANITITGSDAGDLFGWDVAGNINIDGNDAVVVGAPGESGNGKEGSVYVFYESVLIEGATLDADEDANEKIIGENAEDKFGASVSGAGDGFVVGAWSGSSVEDTGETLTYDYTGSSKTIDVSSVGQIDVIMYGAGGGGGYDGLGGDGGLVEATFDVFSFDDIEIWVGECGKYVTSNTDNATGGWGRHMGGNSSTYGWTGSGGGSTEIVASDGTFLAAADAGGGGADLVDPGGGGGGARGGLGGTGEETEDDDGEDAEGDGFGGRGGNATNGEEDGINGSGSINNNYLVGTETITEGGGMVGGDSSEGENGKIDITFYEFKRPGRVYFFDSGTAFSSSASDADEIFVGHSDGDMFGFSVDNGDVDNDGNFDILIGAPGEDETYVFFGPDFTKEINLPVINSGGSFGWSASNIGNFLGTGGDSVAVGAPNSDNGKVYIYSADEIASTETYIYDDTQSDFTKTGSSLGEINPNLNVYADVDGILNLTKNYHIDDDFEGANLDSWEISKGRNTEISISDDYANSGTQSVLLDDYGTHQQDDSGSIYQQITNNLQGGVSEVWVRTTDDSDPFRFFLLDNDAEDPESTLVIFREGEIRAYDGETPQTITNYDPNTWYHIKVEFDCFENKYDLFIDDMEQPALQDLNFLNEQNSIDTMYFASLDGETSTTYFDDAKLYDYSGVGYYQSAITNTEDNINSVKYHWNVTNPSGSDIWVNISRDGGTTWNQSSLVESRWYSFNGDEPIGSELVYNVTFKSSGLTPKLEDIKIYYSTLTPFSVIEGASSGDKFGYSIDAGDFTDNSYFDLIIGAPYNNNQATDGGAIYVFEGDLSFPTSATTEESRYYYYGNLEGQHLGWSVSYMGDMNSDSNPDIGVGSPFNNNLDGHVDVLTAVIPEFPTIFFPIFIAILTPALFWKKKRQND